MPVADSYDRTTFDRLRVHHHPPGSTIRLPQHRGDQSGDVDFDEVFAAGIGFDGVLTTCVFGCDEQARKSGTRVLAAIRALVTQNFPDGTTP